MNFSLLKSFKLLLFPFSLLYGLGVTGRNYLFDKNILKSVSFNLPIICVGNLSVGGTGKSPMVEYLINLLKAKYNVATLSRGYKRKTRGFLVAGDETTTLEIGDEPMQIHTKFPEVAVAVGEQRILAVPQLLQQKPGTNVIILDDAFQHRSIRPGLNILLTSFNNLFTKDFFLPSGDLRDEKSSSKRAGIIVVTKCPDDLKEEERNKIKKEIKILPHQNLFFTTLEYGELYHITTKEKKKPGQYDEILLVSGIANPQPLNAYLSRQVKAIYPYRFPDHHTYTNKDIGEMKKKFAAIGVVKKIIVTTEKDAVRLIKFEKEMIGLPLFVLPVQHRFLYEEGVRFDNLINIFIEDFFNT